MKVKKKVFVIKQLKIIYTNHKNETKEYSVLPMSIWYGATEWHPKEQWFLKAKDVKRDVRRDFALVHISNFAYPDADVPFIDTVVDNPEQKEPKKAENDTDLSEAKMFTDGGSRGNPGPAASGYVILNMEDNVVKKEGVYLGINTNNQAEYRALEAGLQDALTLGIKELHVYMDSLLVVNQVQGLWKIKNPEFMPLLSSIRGLITKFDHVTLTHVPRAMNKIADGMVNEILDAAEDDNATVI